LAGVAAVIVLLDITIRNHGSPHFAAIVVYAVGLLAMLGFSAAYSLTRPSRAGRKHFAGAIMAPSS
jgi:uncharacterized membrane protein YhhN